MRFTLKPLLCKYMRNTIAHGARANDGYLL